MSARMAWAGVPATLAAATSLRTFLATFPNLDSGKSSTSSGRSGSLNRASPLSARKATSSSSVTERPSRRIAKAHSRSGGADLAAVLAALALPDRLP